MTSWFSRPYGEGGEFNNDRQKGISLSSRYAGQSLFLSDHPSALSKKNLGYLLKGWGEKTSKPQVIDARKIL